jgi:hypothetical protein
MRVYAFGNPVKDHGKVLTDLAICICAASMIMALTAVKRRIITMMKETLIIASRSLAFGDGRSHRHLAIAIAFSAAA